jgi:hypothetical protein
MGSTEQAPAQHRELCSRCKQHVSFQDVRCPNCGQPLSGTGRHLSLWIGIGGVFAILFVVGLMWLVVHEDDVLKRPVPVDQATASQQSDILPETPKTTGKEEPAKPDKAPPLNR